jgi:hypothetical protein
VSLVEVCTWDKFIVSLNRLSANGAMLRRRVAVGRAEAGSVARRLSTVITVPSVRANITSMCGCGGLCRGRGASIHEDDFLKKCEITVVSLRQVAMVFDEAVGFRRVSSKIGDGRRRDLLQDSSPGVVVSSGVGLWCKVRRMLGSRMLQGSGRGTGGEGKRAGAAGGKRHAGLWL